MRREPIKLTRKTRVVDARPMVEQNRALAELRKRKGLVEAWTVELNRLPVDLRAMAQNLMAEVTEFFVRSSGTPHFSTGW